MNYEYSYPFIEPSKVRSIFELGSRDCEDAVALANRFQCPVIAFEANSDVYEVCRETIRKSNCKYPITLVEKAVYITDGSIPFWSVDKSKESNVGASSMLEHCSDEWNKLTRKIEVPSTRLDTFLDEQNLATPELICMDLQGAELSAIQSLGSRLADVQYVATEMAFVPNYKGATHFQEFNEFMTENGFVISFIPFSRKYVFDVLNKNSQPPSWEFDMVYERQD